MRLIWFLLFFLFSLVAYGEESVNLPDNLPVREAAKSKVVKDDEVRNVVEDRQYLFENFFFFEEGDNLEKRLLLDESLVHRINSPTLFLTGQSLLEDVEATRFSSLSKEDQSKFLLQNVSLLIYPWNFFINQFFLLHDIRFSIYVENTYLYSDIASSFYKNFQSINVEPESVWYFRFRYVW